MSGNVCVKSTRWRQKKKRLPLFVHGPRRHHKGHQKLIITVSLACISMEMHVSLEVAVNSYATMLKSYVTKKVKILLQEHQCLAASRGSPAQYVSGDSICQ